MEDIDFCCDYARDCYEKFHVNDYHYHCARCNGRTGMMGHYTSFCKNKPVMRKGKLLPNAPHHMCCPGDCELDGEG